jgi:hypothetical protein
MFTASPPEPYPTIPVTQCQYFPLFLHAFDRQAELKYAGFSHTFRPHPQAQSTAIAPSSSVARTGTRRTFVGGTGIFTFSGGRTGMFAFGPTFDRPPDALRGLQMGQVGEPQAQNLGISVVKPDH